MPPADFYLAPSLISAWRGQRFFEATDIIQNAKKELKRLPQMASINVSNTFTVTGGSV
jgi:hypothetical protein